MKPNPMRLARSAGNRKVNFAMISRTSRIASTAPARYPKEISEISSNVSIPSHKSNELAA